MSKTVRNVTSEPGKVGRPPLGEAKMVPIRLPAEMIAAIDALAGPGKRAEFIRAAIEREIKRRASAS